MKREDKFVALTEFLESKECDGELDDRLLALRVNFDRVEPDNVSMKFILPTVFDKV
jgi:hypothetical protein